MGELAPKRNSRGWSMAADRNQVSFGWFARHEFYCGDSEASRYQDCIGRRALRVDEIA